MYWRVGIQQANSTGFPLPILFETLASAMGEEEKEDELVDIEMHAHAFFRVCLVLIFLNTIVEKTYPVP